MTTSFVDIKWTSDGDDFMRVKWDHVALTQAHIGLL